MTAGGTLVSRVELSIRRHGLFKPGDTLIVAFSGGADSTALLNLLSSLPAYNLTLIAAHLNHCLRGVESDADEDFCRDLAARHAIPFEVKRIDVKKFAEEQCLNLEDAGRRVRIKFFDEIRMKYGATVVALAHHADDQAETVLMRLLRGSGMTGLSGMAYRNARGYVRPLLEISRSEIEQYLHDKGQLWREDASNSDTNYLRNRIRHQLLPLLEEYNPAIRTSLAMTASLLGGDEALLEELTENVFSGVCQVGEGKVECSVTQLRTLAPALQRRVLRAAFRQLAGTLSGVSLRHIEAICDIVDAERPNSRLMLPHLVSVVRAYDKLSFIQADNAAGDADFELLITGPGRYQLPDGATVTVGLPTTEIVHTTPDSAFFDLARTPFPWLIRTFRPGDRIVPFGMHGRKKVKDIFIDKKIPLSERTRIPLLVCGDDLLWIMGITSSERCRINQPGPTVVQATRQL